MDESRAPLGATASPPIEADISLAAGDGVALMARHWASPRGRGVLVVSHGFGEHGGSYRGLAEALVGSLGLDVLAFDYRGHGRSGGKRGVVRTYADLSLDLAAAIDWATKARPGRRPFLFGHSNGGLVAIGSILHRGGDPGLAGLILSNPSLRVTAEVPPWKRAAGEVLRRVAPSVTLDAGLSAAQLTTDPEILATLQGDPLRHRRISPRLYFGMVAAGPVALARAGEVRLPALVLLGGADHVTDPESGRLFFDRLGSPDKTLEFYPEMRHEPLNEAGRGRVIADIDRWIGDRLG